MPPGPVAPRAPSSTNRSVGSGVHVDEGHLDLGDPRQEARHAAAHHAGPDDRDPVALLGALRFRLAPRFESLGLRLDWEGDGERQGRQQGDAGRKADQGFRHRQILRTAALPNRP